MRAALRKADVIKIAKPMNKFVLFVKCFVFGWWIDKSSLMRVSTTSLPWLMILKLFSGFLSILDFKVMFDDHKGTFNYYQKRC